MTTFLGVPTASSGALGIKPAAWQRASMAFTTTPSQTMIGVASRPTSMARARVAAAIGPSPSAIMYGGAMRPVVISTVSPRLTLSASALAARWQSGAPAFSRAAS